MHLLATNYFQEILKMIDQSGANTNQQRANQIPNHADKSAEIWAEISTKKREEFENFLATTDHTALLKTLFHSMLEENAEDMIEATNKLTNRETLKLLVKLDKINIGHDESSYTLMRAVMRNKPKVVELLVELGADLNAPDGEGFTPLMEAIINNNLEMVELLVKLGADIDATALILAVEDKNLKMVKFLVDLDADINAKDREGRTALIRAVDYNNLKMVQLLVELGADLNAPDGEGFTPLMEAIINNNLEMVELLKELGADINAKDNSGKTLLMRAVMLNKPEMVKLLVKLGVDINAKDCMTALPYVLHTEIIKFLLSKTTDENLEEAINETAQFNPQSLLCILYGNNNLRKIIENNIPNLITAVQSKEIRTESLNPDEMNNYITSLMALANLAVFNISDPADKEKTESSIQFAAKNSLFINTFFNFSEHTSPNTTTRMCYIGFLMTLTKLGFFNISDSTTTTETTETEENGAETIVTEILKITFQHKESGKSITVSVEPELKKYVFDILIRLNPPNNLYLYPLTVLAKNVIKRNDIPVNDEKLFLPKPLQEYTKQQPSSQEIIENIEILRGSRFR